ncbi:hypothetical protein [Polyangium aurulentum]|uniref:hypothetical protein n=1 Tax=Polyangium aurulentum TaxID=2567896 RepID=UPI0010AE76BE|nr:hypothetical protein [Polyangium aurulentum]UQA57165.1 hypothetical protein E8A73_038635 [Polyangium aurulentum]
MPVERAARVTSPVQHMSSTARDIAAPAGIAIGAAIVVSAYFTGGISLLVISAAFGAAGVTTSAGEMLDTYALSPDASEKIEKGVEHVFLEEAKHQAANVSGVTLTDQHVQSPTTGSESITIETGKASRRYDLTQCNGQIVDGAAHILYGGVPGRESDEPGDAPTPLWRDVIEKGITYGGLAVGGYSWWTSGRQVLDGAFLAADLIKETGAVDGPAADAGYFGKDLYSLGNDLSDLLR